MESKLYTIYDQKAEIYLPPFCFPTHGAAVRAFTETVNDPQSNIAKHPEDYNLFYIGTWDDNSALFEAASPANLGGGLEFKNNEPDPYLPLSAPTDLSNKLNAG